MDIFVLDDPRHLALAACLLSGCDFGKVLGYHPFSTTLRFAYLSNSSALLGRWFHFGTLTLVTRGIDHPRKPRHFDSGVGTLCLRMLWMGLPAYVRGSF